MTDTDIQIKIDAVATDASREIKSLTKQIDRMNKTIAKGGKVSTQNVGQMTRSFKSLTAHVSKLALIYGTFKTLLTSTVITAQFEQSIKKLGVYSGTTAIELAELEDRAKDLGESTIFSASQVAEGMNEMALAGLASKEMLDGIGDILNLASIGMIDLKTATDFAITSMKAFGLESEDVNDITDIFAKTSTISATNVTQLGQALSKVGQVAHAYNVSLEETASALGVLADAGRRGSEAGTQLKIVFQRLAGNKEALKYLDELGISMYDLDGKLLPFTQQLLLVKNRLQDMSEKARNIKLAQIFGAEASASAIALLNNLDEVNSKLEQVRQAMLNDYASKSAKEIVDTLVGSYKNLISALEGLAIKIISELTPALRQMLDTMTETIRGMDEEKIAEFAGSIGALVETLTAFIGIMGDASGATFKFIQDNGNLVVYVAGLLIALKKLNPALILYMTNMKMLTATTMPLIAGTVALTGVFLSYIDAIERETKAVQLQVKLQEKRLLGFDRVSKAIVDSLNKETGAIGDSNTERAKLASTVGKLLSKLIVEEKVMKQGALTNEQYANNKKIIRDQITSLFGVLDRIGVSWEKETEVIEKVTTAQITLNEATVDAIKNYNRFEVSLNKRVSSTYKAIDRILKKEQKLYDNIKKIEQEKSNIYKEYTDKRANLAQDYDQLLYNARTQDLDEHKKHLSDKLRASELLRKAEEALSSGMFDEAGRYYAEAKSLASSFAGEVIEINDHVYESSKDTYKSASDIYKQTKEGELKILKEKERAEIEANALKMKLIVTELKAQKIQLTVQEALLKSLNNLGASAKKNLANFDNISVFDEAKKDLSDLISSIEKTNVNIKTNVIIDDDNTVESQIKKMESRYVPTFKAKVNVDEVELNKAKDAIERQDVKKTVDYEPDTQDLDKTEAKLKSDKIISDIEFKADTTEVDSFKDEVESDTIVAELDVDPKRAIGTGVATVNKISAMTAMMVADADARSAINTANRAVSKINRMVAYITVKTKYVASLGGFIPQQHLAEGGSVFTGSGRVAGYDPTDSDKVSAKLTGGEFVVKREAVDSYGLSILHSINNMRYPKPTGYATGGFVGGGSNVSSPSMATPINLNVGGKSFGMTADRDIAEALQRFLENEGGL